MPIWIVRKHPPYPYGAGWLREFSIHSTYSNRAEAQAIVDKKMRNKNTTYLYTIARIGVKGAA